MFLDPSKERPMRRSAGFLVVLFVTVLTAGCTSETSAPAPEPAKVDVSRADVEKSPKSSTRQKKKKEPGLGLVPKVSTRSGSAL
jgi:hypothetical protein